jgi:hypothetical protein
MLVACYQNIRQVIYKDKIQQFFAGMCDCPTIFGVMLHNQAMGFCNLLKAFVVVGIATAGVLDRMNVGYIVRWTSVLTTRFDTKTFKEKFGEEVYKAFTKQVSSRRFSISA